MKVKALWSFIHGGHRKKGSVFDIDDRTARQLIQKGLVAAHEDSGGAPVDDRIPFKKPAAVAKTETETEAEMEAEMEAETEPVVTKGTKKK